MEKSSNVMTGLLLAILMLAALLKSCNNIAAINHEQHGAHRPLLISFATTDLMFLPIYLFFFPFSFSSFSFSKALEFIVSDIPFWPEGKEIST